MNEQKQVTIGDALRMVIDNLEGINIPISMLQQIGLPVAESINILRDVYRVMQENEKKAREEADDIQVELLTEPKPLEAAEE